MGRLLNFGREKKDPGSDYGSQLGDASFVVIDTELTGLNETKDSIVSFGAVRMVGGRISLGDSFYRMVKPKAALTRESVVIHGIMPCDLVHEADSAAVLSEFRAFCGNDILVGHCIEIDLAFITRELDQELGRRLGNRIVDTAALYGWIAGRGLLDRGFQSPSSRADLYRMARCFDIQVVEIHHALADAFITAQLFQRFLPLLKEEGIVTMGDLVRIGNPNRGGDRFRATGDFSNF